MSPDFSDAVQTRLRFFVVTVAVCVPVATLTKLLSGSDRLAFTVMLFFFVPLVAVYSVARYFDASGWPRSREEMLSTLLKLEEATILVDEGLNTLFRSMAASGIPPTEPGPLERIQRATVLATDVRAALASFRPRDLLGLLATGLSGMTRFLMAVTEVKRLQEVIERASAMLKSALARGGGGGSSPLRAEPLFAYQLHMPDPTALINSAATVRANVQALVVKERNVVGRRQATAELRPQI